MTRYPGTRAEAVATRGRSLALRDHARAVHHEAVEAVAASRNVRHVAVLRRRLFERRGGR